MEREHIVLLDINQLMEESMFEACLKQVPKKRQEQIAGCAKKADKMRSLGAGLVLEAMLKNLDINLSKSPLEYGEHGKPFVPNRPDVHFNLSHSGDYAAGIWGKRPVGIDIEKIGKMNRQVVRRFFHEGERRYLEGFSREEEQIQAFFRLWVLKESFMKVTGLGMRLPLNSFEISIGSGEIQVLHPLNHKQYSFQEFSMEGYRGAVCSEDERGGSPDHRSVKMLVLKPAPIITN